MKRRKESDDLLFRNRTERGRSLKGKKKKVHKKKRQATWSNLVKLLNRKLNLGDLVINFPAELDIFNHHTEWFTIFSALTYSNKQMNRLMLNNLNFIYPEAVVYLAAVCDHLLRRSNAEIREYFPIKKETNEYLNVCGLREFFNVPKLETLIVDPKFFGECIPISRDPDTKVSSGQKMAELISSRLEMDTDTLQLLSEALGEAMGNAIEHGEVRAWYRIGQIHKQRGAITIAIADNGVGVPQTLRRGYNGVQFKSLTDSQLLKKSFESDVTKYKPKAGEAHGYGLTRIWKYAEQKRAKIAMLSGKGLYRVDFTNGTVFENFVNFNKQLPGTLIVLRIPFDAERNKI